jgi:hypothetical protein
VSVDLLVMHLESHQDQIRSDVVKICRHAVVLQIVLELHVKPVMDQILAEHALHQWTEINLDCVHEFSNQTFLKM